MRKLKKKGVACNECMDKIVGSIVEDDNRHKFLVHKNWEGAKVGLTVPSNALLGILQITEIEYSKVIDECIVKEGVKANLLCKLLQCDKFDILKCERCHLDKMM